MSEGPAVPTGKPSSPLRWLLVASLALNVLVVGLVAGAALRHRWVSGDAHLGHVARALAPEDRRAILGVLRDRRSGPQGRDGWHAGMGEIVAAIRAEPFDRARADAALAAQAARVAEAEGGVRDAILDRLDAMTVPERTGFADRLEAELARRPGRD